MKLEEEHFGDKEQTKFTDQKGTRFNRLLNQWGPRVCLSVIGFGVLVALCTFVFTVAAVILGTVYLLRKRE